MSDDSIIGFPCEFPIKVLGNATDTFDLEIATLVRRHVPDLSEGAITSRPSKSGNYLSVTIVVRATSQAQLDAIYLELTASELVIMAL